MSELNPKIYVTCLRSYNTGMIRGAWINATQSVEKIQSQISDMLKGSPISEATRYAIRNFEGFDTLEINENASLDQVAGIAKFLSEHGKLGIHLVEYFNDLECARRAWEENYCGCYPSQEAFVADWLEETGMEIPKLFQGYIDYTAMARDWFICDFFSIRVQGQEHVFYQS